MSNSKLEVLTPQNSQIIFIDQQPQMAFGVQSMDRQALKNNVVGLAKAAKVFKIPTTITSVRRTPMCWRGIFRTNMERCTQATISWKRAGSITSRPSGRRARPSS